MSKFTVQITNVTTGGPYAYVVFKDGDGIKAATGQASVTAALDAVKADIGNNLAGQTVFRVGMDITTG